MQYVASAAAPAVQTVPAQYGQANLFQQLDANGDGMISREEFARVAQTLQAPAAAPSQTVTYTMAQPQQLSNTMYSAAAQPVVFAGCSGSVPPVAQTTQQVQYISAAPSQAIITAAPQYSTAPAVQQATTYVTQSSPVITHQQSAPVRQEPQPNLEHRVVGERHITREELLETGNLVETEGSVVQSNEPPSTLLSQQSRPAVAAQTYQAAKTYATPSASWSGNNTVTYSSPQPVLSQGMTYVQSVQPMTMMTAPVAQQGDFFDVFDANHDGIIDRSEFQQAAAATMNMGVYSGAPSMAVTSSSSQCPACGNMYAADSVFCRKCGRQRDQAGSLSGGPVAII